LVWFTSRQSKRGRRIELTTTLHVLSVSGPMGKFEHHWIYFFFFHLKCLKNFSEKERKMIEDWSEGFFRLGFRPPWLQLWLILYIWGNFWSTVTIIILWIWFRSRGNFGNEMVGYAISLTKGPIVFHFRCEGGKKWALYTNNYQTSYLLFKKCHACYSWNRVDFFQKYYKSWSIINCRWIVVVLLNWLSLYFTPTRIWFKISS